MFNRNLINTNRQAGARVQIHADGDLASALMAGNQRYNVEVMMGFGGVHEAVMASCALPSLGGDILTRLDPQLPEEKEALVEAGIDLEQARTAKDLAQSDDVFLQPQGYPAAPCWAE